MLRGARLSEASTNFVVENFSDGKIFVRRGRQFGEKCLHRILKQNNMTLRGFFLYMARNSYIYKTINNINRMLFICITVKQNNMTSRRIVLFISVL